MLIRGLLRVAMLVLGVLPRRLVLLWAALLGWTWYYLVPVRRRWVRAHLRAVYGDELSRSDRRTIARRVYVELCKNLVELLTAHRALRKSPTWIRYEDEHHLHTARESGRPVILVTAHIGNYDLMACHFARYREPLAIVSKRLSTEALNQAWMETRASFGLSVLPRQGALAEASKLLSRGELVGFVLDQHAPERRAVEAPFLGLPARTSAALATLAIRTDALIVPVFVTRAPDDSHRVRFEPPIAPAVHGDLRARIEATTREALAAVERAVRAHPAQWLWLHRRWKSADGTPIVSPTSTQRQLTTSASGTRS